MRAMTVKTHVTNKVNTNSEKEALLREERKKVEEIRRQLESLINYREEKVKMIYGYIPHEYLLEKMANHYGFTYINDEKPLVEHLGVDEDHALQFINVLLTPKKILGSDSSTYYLGILYSPTTSMYYLVKETEYRELGMTKINIYRVSPSELKDMVEHAPWISLP